MRNENRDTYDNFGVTTEAGFSYLTIGNARALMPITVRSDDALGKTLIRSARGIVREGARAVVARYQLESSKAARFGDDAGSPGAPRRFLLPTYLPRAVYRPPFARACAVEKARQKATFLTLKSDSI